MEKIVIKKSSRSTERNLEVLVQHFRHHFCRLRNVQFFGFEYELQTKLYFRFKLYNTLTVLISVPFNLDKDSAVALVETKILQELEEHLNDKI